MLRRYVYNRNQVILKAMKDGLQNKIQLFKKIETTIKESKEEQMTFAPFTQSEIIARAKKSNDDYVNGNTTDQDTLEKESESWWNLL